MTLFTQISNTIDLHQFLLASSLTAAALSGLVFITCLYQKKNRVPSALVFIFFALLSYSYFVLWSWKEIGSLYQAFNCTISYLLQSFSWLLFFPPKDKLLPLVKRVKKIILVPAVFFRFLFAFSHGPSRQLLLYSKKNNTMKRPTLYSLIGELRERYDSCRFLNKQRIIDLAVNHFQKLLVSSEVIKVTEILLENYNDSAIYDFLNPTN